MAGFARPLSATTPPPVMEARRWIEGMIFPPENPLINLSQAAPTSPPPAQLRQEMARLVLEETEAHLYGPVLGLPELRQEIAETTVRIYGGDVTAEQVAVTSGCNQAFCAAVQSLAEAGDAVMLPVPWYFNHKMWLDMQGIETRALPCGPDLIPNPEEAAALLDKRVKAIVLVTPNNPTGVEYPPEVIARFAQLARAANIALIVDETYRDFHSAPGAPHPLFEDPDWDETLVHLYSFSKVYRLTGHRVGALITSVERLSHIQKVLDTTTICANQIGQRAALYGMRHLAQWVAGERQEILHRRACVEQGFAELPDWQVMGTGAYFAYVKFRATLPSEQIALHLVKDRHLLVLPGSMFAPPDVGDLGGTTLRFAFANADEEGLSTMFERLRAPLP